LNSHNSPTKMSSELKLSLIKKVARWSHVGTDFLSLLIIIFSLHIYHKVSSAAGPSSNSSEESLQSGSLVDVKPQPMAAPGRGVKERTSPRPTTGRSSGHGSRRTPSARTMKSAAARRRSSLEEPDTGGCKYIVQ